MSKLSSDDAACQLTVTPLPNWHANRPEVLADARTAALRIAPASGALVDTFLPALPCGLRVSSRANGATSRTMRLADAIGQPYVALNNPTARNALIFRLGPGWKAGVANLPASIRPILIVDPQERHGFAVLLLQAPVITTDKARIGPQKFADLVEAQYAKALGATRLPPLAFVPSPWRDPLTGTAQLCPSWHVIAGSGPVKLHTVLHALSAADDRFSGNDAREEHDTLAGISATNRRLFNEVRWRFYRQPTASLAEILTFAERVNAHNRRPVCRINVIEMCERVFAFLRDVFVSSRKRRQSDLPRHEAQAKAGRDSAQRKLLKTRRTLNDAIARWPAGDRLTQAALARTANVCERTIRAHWPHLDRTGSSLRPSGSERYTRAESVILSKELVKSATDYGAPIADREYYLSYIKAAAAPRAMPDSPRTPPSGWDDPDIAWAYRHAEIAWEDTRHRNWRRRKTIDRLALRWRLHHAGRRNAISVLVESLQDVEHRLETVRPYLERKWGAGKFHRFSPHVKEQMEHSLQRAFGRVK